MIAYGDESALGEMFQHLAAIHAELDFKVLLHHPAHELRSGSVAPSAMDCVHLVHLEETQQEIHQFLVPLQLGQHLPQVFIDKHIRTYLAGILYCRECGGCIFFSLHFSWE